MNNAKERSPFIKLLLSKGFWIAVMLNFCLIISNSLTKQPTTLIGSNLGLSASIIGILGTVYSIGSMLARGPYGELVDRSKKIRAALALSFIGKAIVQVAFGLCASTALFCVLKFFEGVVFAATNSAMMLVIAKTVDRRAMGRAYGLVTLIPKLFSGYVVKLALGITNSGGQAGVAKVFLVAAVITLIPAAMCFLLKIQENDLTVVKARKEKSGGINMLIFLPVLPLCIILILNVMAGSITNNFIVLYGKEAGMPELATNYLASASVATGVCGFIIGWLYDLIGFKSSSILCAVCNAIGLILVGNTTSSALWVTAAWLSGLGGSIQNVIRAEAIELGGRELNGKIVGTVGLTMALSNMITTGIGGFVVDGIGYSASFNIFSGLAIASVLIIIFFGDKFKAILAKANPENAVIKGAEAAESK